MRRVANRLLRRLFCWLLNLRTNSLLTDNTQRLLGRLLNLRLLYLLCWCVKHRSQRRVKRRYSLSRRLRHRYLRCLYLCGCRLLLPLRAWLLRTIFALRLLLLCLSLLSLL